MPRVKYKDINFRAASLKLIDLVNGVIREYSAQGYELTLRQAYYQLVARGYIPNNERSYKNIGALINDGRLAGLIDWNAITDRTRNIRANSHWDDPAEIISSASRQFMLDKWEDQPVYVEVWVEKDARSAEDRQRYSSRTGRMRKLRSDARNAWLRQRVSAARKMP